MKWLKQFFCKHWWDRSKMVHPVWKEPVIELRCVRCGKVEYNSHIPMEAKRAR